MYWTIFCMYGNHAIISVCSKLLVMPSSFQLFIAHTYRYIDCVPQLWENSKIFGNSQTAFKWNWSVLLEHNDN